MQASCRVIISGCTTNCKLPAGANPILEQCYRVNWLWRRKPDVDSERNATIRVRLTPRGGRNAVSRREGDLLYVRVAAPPVEGAANRALIALLADTLGIAKSRIAIVSGESSRDKL